MNSKQQQVKQKFVQSGHFAAIPLKVPGETLPINEDESYISTIIENPAGTLFFGATAGTACHIFTGAAKGSCFGIIDLGIIKEAKNIPVMIYEKHHNEHKKMPINTIIVAANSTDSILFYRYHTTFPLDTFQEPSFFLPQIDKIGELPDHQIYDAVLCPDGKNIFCLTDGGIFNIDLQSNDITSIFSSDLTSIQVRNFAITNNDTAFFASKEGTLICLNLIDRSCNETIMTIPFSGTGCNFCVTGNRIITASPAGEIFSFDTEQSKITLIGKTIFPDVQCMSALPTGTVYGICGKQIGYFFKFNPATGNTENMGAIASTLETRRYGFEFSKMLTGKDGEIYMCENDRGGHLWIYFPPTTS